MSDASERPGRPAAGIGRRGFLGASAAVLAAPAVLASAQGASAEPLTEPAGPLTEPTDPRVERLLARMTLADKIAQLNMPQVLPKPFIPATSPAAQDADRKKYAAGTWLSFLGPGGGFLGLANETVFGAIPVAAPHTPRQQAEAAPRRSQGQRVPADQAAPRFRQGRAAAGTDQGGPADSRSPRTGTGERGHAARGRACTFEVQIGSSSARIHLRDTFEVVR